MEKYFKACVRSFLLYGSETWPLSTEDLSRIRRCDHAMIRWLSNAKLEQKHSTGDLRRRVHVHHVKDVLRWNRLRLSGHFYRQVETWTYKITSFNVYGPASRGWPKIRWKNVVNQLTTNVPYHVETSQLISNANQLTGFYMIGNIGR